MRRIKSIAIKTHPSFYSLMESIRKTYKDRCGISLSQTQITNLVSKNINMNKLWKPTLAGGMNVKKKGRSY